MKNSLMLFIWLLTVKVVSAQSANEQEVRRLDQLEAKAMITGDTATLTLLWSPTYLVNNPANRIVNAKQIRQLMKEGKIDYVAFKRVIEEVAITDNVAITMGYEVTQPERQTDNAGKIVTRRYTNVWQNGMNGWRLVARQATNISVK